MDLIKKTIDNWKEWILSISSRRIMQDFVSKYILLNWIYFGLITKDQFWNIVYNYANKKQQHRNKLPDADAARLYLSDTQIYVTFKTIYVSVNAYMVDFHGSFSLTVLLWSLLLVGDESNPWTQREAWVQSFEHSLVLCLYTEFIKMHGCDLLFFVSIWISQLTFEHVLLFHSSSV